MSYLARAAKYYIEEPHQTAAWNSLEASLPENVLQAFEDAYRKAPEAPKLDGSNPVDCVYFYQNDNESGTGYRECFSSSCAMLAAFFGKVETDDEYNLVRQSFGDSTATHSQLKALTYYGLKPEYHQNGSVEDLKREIDEGYPVAVGWLHSGSIDWPQGGGHWSVVIGYTDTGFIVHDPNGEANLVRGGYVNHWNGEAIHYSYKNWVPRWAVEGEGSGWYLTCRS